MTRFTVVWRNEAQDDLAEIWLKEKSERNAIAKSQQDIDAVLAVDAHEKGDTILEDLRRIDIHPLRAYFEVYMDDRQIKVSQIIYKPQSSE